MLSVSELTVISCDGRKILGPVSFDAEPGDVIGVYGEEDSGKTSLLLAFAGIPPAVKDGGRITGDIALDGQPIGSSETSNRTTIVSDNPYGQVTGLNNTLWQELLFPAEAHGVPKEKAEGMASVVAANINLLQKKDCA